MVNDFQKLQQGYGDTSILGCSVAYGKAVFAGGGGTKVCGLSCNAPASKKHGEEDTPMTALPTAQLPDDVTFYDVYSQPLRCPTVASATAAALAGLAQMRSGAAESGITSTSGCPPAAASSALLGQDLSPLYQQNLEVDALLRLQSDWLCSAVEAARMRHCQQLLVGLDRQASRRLREKELELENAARRNAELEEKIRQMSAECQIWFNVAKNNEALVSTLGTTLKQVLDDAVVASSEGGAAGSHDCREGFGDSDDARSLYFNTAGHRPEWDEASKSLQRKTCRVCGEADSSVLLLPCRHLCLCRRCESIADTCPVCRSPRNASIQILLS